jgi:hypothetical protein
MVRAVVSRGEIRPLDPLPADWPEGLPLRVEPADEEREMTPEEIDRDFEELNRLCADSDPADELRMEQALRKAHEQAKNWVRKDMGLTG